MRCAPAARFGRLLALVRPKGPACSCFGPNGRFGTRAQPCVGEARRDGFRVRGRQPTRCGPREDFPQQLAGRASESVPGAVIGAVIGTGQDPNAALPSRLLPTTLATNVRASASRAPRAGRNLLERGLSTPQHDRCVACARGSASKSLTGKAKPLRSGPPFPGRQRANSHARYLQTHLCAVWSSELRDHEEQAHDVREVRNQEVLRGLQFAPVAQGRQDLEGLSVVPSGRRSRRVVSRAGRPIIDTPHRRAAQGLQGHRGRLRRNPKPVDRARDRQGSAAGRRSDSRSNRLRP